MPVVLEPRGPFQLRDARLPGLQVRRLQLRHLQGHAAAMRAARLLVRLLPGLHRVSEACLEKMTPIIDLTPLPCSARQGGRLLCNMYKDRVLSLQNPDRVSLREIGRGVCRACVCGTWGGFSKVCTLAGRLAIATLEILFGPVTHFTAHETIGNQSINGQSRTHHHSENSDDDKAKEGAKRSPRLLLLRGNLWRLLLLQRSQSGSASRRRAQCQLWSLLTDGRQRA